VGHKYLGPAVVIPVRARPCLLSVHRAFGFISQPVSYLFRNGSRTGAASCSITIGVVVILVGIFAHWFKRRNQRWYGIVEVIFGIISAFSVAFAMSSDSRYCPSGRH
jgi:hypothetical protein